MISWRWQALRVHLVRSCHVVRYGWSYVESMWSANRSAFRCWGTYAPPPLNYAHAQCLCRQMLQNRSTGEYALPLVARTASYYCVESIDLSESLLFRFVLSRSSSSWVSIAFVHEIDRDFSTPCKQKA